MKKANELVKSQFEVDTITRACNIIGTTIKAIAHSARPGQSEKETAAALEKSMGNETAFETIVALGENSCTLHHHPSNRIAKNGDLLLIDAGCKIDGYCSDMSRTIPVSKKFSSEQKQVYQWIYNAYREALKSAVIGNTIDSIHRSCQQILINALDNLLGKNRKVILEEVFPHKTSHWIGKEVHEKGYYEIDGKSIRLEEGMTLTIEPGLYFTKNLPIPGKYKGIGIRIENTILIKKDGPVELTNQFPLCPDEIEKFLHSKWS